MTNTTYLYFIFLGCILFTIITLYASVIVKDNPTTKNGQTNNMPVVTTMTAAGSGMPESLEEGLLLDDDDEEKEENRGRDDDDDDDDNDDKEDQEEEEDHQEKEGGDDASVIEIKAMTKKEIESWRKIRNNGGMKKYSKEWFSSFDKDKKRKEKLYSNADSNSINSSGGGPILDFVVAGFPKCGTSGLIHALMIITPYPGGDKCSNIHNTVKNAYGQWENKYGISNQTFLKGSKCPKLLEQSYKDFNKYLPKTKLIVGIRHPVLWFQSFYNMQMANFPNHYKNSSSYDILPSDNDNDKDRQAAKRNTFGCIKKQKLFCVARAEFHLAISKLGKTPLIDENELRLLNSVDKHKNEKHYNSTHIRSRNPILLFEINQPKEKYFYNDLSNYLQINTNDILPKSSADIVFYANSTEAKLKRNMTESQIIKMNRRTFDICSVDRDPLRKLLMPISYNLHAWLIQYFIPASQKRKDISISNLTHFTELIKPYQKDPCNRLIRNDNDGSYYLDPQL